MMHRMHGYIKTTPPQMHIVIRNSYLSFKKSHSTVTVEFVQVTLVRSDSAEHSPRVANYSTATVLFGRNVTRDVRYVPAS